MSAAIARFSGRSPFAATSSIAANAKMPAAAGQRPSFSGYASGAGSSPRAAARATHATPRAIARQGLKARNTSPKSTLTGTKPSQKMT